jgi:hypothetical protein
MTNPKAEVSGLYWSTVARFLGWCAALMTVGSVLGAIGGRAREGNAIGALIFGGASFILLRTARLIRVASVRPLKDLQVTAQSAPSVCEITPSPTSSQRLGMLAIVASLSVFVVAISGQWVMHELPSTGLVLPIAFVGMSIVGAVFGFLVSGVANVALRSASAVLRVPLTAAIWLLFCAVVGALLMQVGDQKRLLTLVGIASFWGLLVGPYNAELFVAAWLLKRQTKLVTD